MRGVVKLALILLAAFVTSIGVVQLGMLFFVRSGAETRVPSVVGQDIDAARSALGHAGFTGVKEREAYSPQFANGQVSEQRPTAGSTLRKGRKVWLTVSLGERRASVPSLQGMSVRQAGIALQRERLETGTVSRAYHSHIERGDVVAQDPPSGSSVPESARVDVLVSLGPEPRAWILPDLTGRPVGDVEGILNRAGLHPGERTVLLNRSVPAGTVLEHDPPPGSRVEEGQRVDLVVSSQR